jgi:Resolvase, N terminal domain
MGSTTASRRAAGGRFGGTVNDHFSRLDRTAGSGPGGGRSNTGWCGGTELAAPGAPAEFGEFGSQGEPLAMPTARSFPKRAAGPKTGRPHRVLVVVYRAAARPAVVVERAADPVISSGALLVDGYVRSSPPRAWSGSPASIDRGLIGRCVLGRGWRVGRVFEEPTAARPADRGSRLREALERVESGESDGLVVARFKNLGSSLEEAVAVLERIQAAGGRFVSVCDGIDLGASNGRMILRLLLSVLEW